MPEKQKDERSKTWAIIAYPESMPENWETILREMLIDIAISPLHDKDINPTGEPKKPHYHIVLRYSSNKSYQQVLNDIAPLNCPHPQKVKSLKGQIRYLIHSDNPEKAQYNQSDITIIGSWDISNYFSLTQNDRYNMIAEMMDFIDDNQITEFNSLLRYSRAHRREDWFPLLCDNSAYIIDKYICSIRNELKEARNSRVQN